MKQNRSVIALFAVALVSAMLCASAPNSSEDADAQKRAAITQTAQAFVEAFHKGDAKALAAFWTPDGDYVDVTGRVLKGRKAMEDDFTKLFAENKGLTLRIDVASVRFPTADTAVEDGTTSVMSPDGGVPNRANYTNVLVNKDGHWLLASVRELPYLPPSNYHQLRGLEWVIGEWADQAADGHIGHVSFAWAPGDNFIVSERAVEVKDVFLENGTQTIGWDPAAKQIRSWSFESDGGFGEGVWTQDGQNWTIKTTGVLRSGSKMSATSVVTRVDADTIRWQATSQMLDGKPMPDSAPITMKRVK